MPAESTGDSNRIAMNEQTPLLELVRERNYSGSVTGHAPKRRPRPIDPRESEERCVYSMDGATSIADDHRRKAKGYRLHHRARWLVVHMGILKEECCCVDKDNEARSLGGLSTSS